MADLLKVVGKYFLPLVCGLASLLIVTGCATDEKSKENEGKTFEVTADHTPFYRYGPQQGGGPDLSLQRGRMVKLIKRSFGYSQVQLDDGVVGYVATSDLSRTPTPEGMTGAGDDLLTGTGAFNPDNNSAIVERYFVDSETPAYPLPSEPDPTTPIPAQTPATQTPTAPSDLPGFRY